MAYNGWKNYETWAVGLWIDNDEGGQSYWLEAAQDAYDNARASSYASRSEMAKYSLADRMKDEMEDGKDEMLLAAKQSASLWADLLGAALCEVDWHELAEHYLADIDQADEVAA